MKYLFQETDPQREARMLAIQAIRSISNWLYWQSPSSSRKTSGTDITHITYKLPEPNIDKLRDAAAKKQVRERTKTNNQTPLNSKYPDEYWVPSTYTLPSSTRRNDMPEVSKVPSSSTKDQREANDKDLGNNENQNHPIRWGFPVVTAMIAVATVRLHGGGSIHELKEHAGGSLALDIVNSPWSQSILAAATWYMIGMAIIELVAIAGSKRR